MPVPGISLKRALQFLLFHSWEPELPCKKSSYPAEENMKKPQMERSNHSSILAESSPQTTCQLNVATQAPTSKTSQRTTQLVPIHIAELWAKKMIVVLSNWILECLVIQITNGNTSEGSQLNHLNESVLYSDPELFKISKITTQKNFLGWPSGSIG